MLTVADLSRAVAAPFFLALLIGVAGRWRRWNWSAPLAVGAGFLLGYALVALPRLPPADGTDWLFWAAIPLTILGVVDAMLNVRWGSVFGAAAGAVALLVLLPIVPNTVPPATAYLDALGAAAIGALLCLMLQSAQKRLGFRAVTASLCIAVGAAAVMVLSCNLRIVGVYGLGATAALGAAICFGGSAIAARGIAVVAVSILAGLLVAGTFYPDPGVPLPAAIVLLGSPLILFIAGWLPVKKRSVRIVIGLLCEAIVVGSIVGPAALTAKKAAEADNIELRSPARLLLGEAVDRPEPPDQFHAVDANHAVFGQM
jgi:hypothetical protein